jgi:putative flippase GtrA
MGRFGIRLQLCSCSHFNYPAESAANGDGIGMKRLRGGPAAWLRDPELRRFATFLVVGGLNTLVGYAIFAALILMGLSTAVAAIVGTILGVLFNFFSTGGVVFKNQAARLLPRFIAVYVVQMALNVAALRALESAGLHALVAGALVLPPLAVFTYFALRHFVFRPPAA